MCLSCCSGVHLLVADVEVLLGVWLFFRDLVQHLSVRRRKWLGLELLVAGVHQELVSGEGGQFELELLVAHVLLLRLPLLRLLTLLRFAKVPRHVLREAHVLLLSAEVDGLLLLFDRLPFAQLLHAVTARGVIVVEGHLELSHDVALRTAQALLA